MRPLIVEADALVRTTDGWLEGKAFYEAVEDVEQWSLFIRMVAHDIECDMEYHIFLGEELDLSLQFKAYALDARSLAKMEKHLRNVEVAKCGRWRWTPRTEVRYSLQGGFGNGN